MDSSGSISWSSRNHYKDNPLDAPAFHCVLINQCRAETLVYYELTTNRKIAPRCLSASEQETKRSLRRVCDRIDPFHLGGAVLEFGDFSERIERRVGKKVGGRLYECKRDENDAVRHRIVLA